MLAQKDIEDVGAVFVIHSEPFPIFRMSQEMYREKKGSLSLRYDTTFIYPI